MAYMKPYWKYNGLKIQLHVYMNTTRKNSINYLCQISRYRKGLNVPFLPEDCIIARFVLELHFTD